jgi:hypothetical protein
MARKSRLRMTGGPGTGFFAFQDIITTVIAFVLLNILFQITIMRGVVDATSGAIDDTRTTVIKLEAELAKLQAAATALSSRIINGSGEDTEAAERNASLAKADIAMAVVSMREVVETLEAQIQKLESSGGVSLVVLEAQAAKNELERLEKALKESSAKLANAEAERSKLRSAAIEAQESLARALSVGQSLWIVSEATATSKQPLFGIATASSIEWYRPGDEKARFTTAASEWGRGRLTLRDHPVTDYYAVVYFRPSASTEFNEIIKSLKDAGYEVGYDVLLENQPVRFAKK